MGSSKPEREGSPSKSKGGGLPRPVLVIFISLLLDLLAFTVILPLFPAILARYQKDDPSGMMKRYLDWAGLITIMHGRSEI